MIMNLNVYLIQFVQEYRWLQLNIEGNFKRYQNYAEFYEKFT